MICKASTLPRVTEGLTYKKVTKEKSHPSAWLFIYDDIKKLICTCRDSYPAPYTEAGLNLLVKSPTRGVGFRIITSNQLKVISGCYNLSLSLWSRLLLQLLPKYYNIKLGSNVNNSLLETDCSVLILGTFHSSCHSHQTGSSWSHNSAFAWFWTILIFSRHHKYLDAPVWAIWFKLFLTANYLLGPY